MEAYLDLPAEEQERFRANLESNATGRLTPMNKTTYDRGLEKGMEEGMERGREEGLVLARLAMLGELLEAKFGPMPADLAARFAATADPATLQRWVVEAGKADTLATFRTRTQL